MYKNRPGNAGVMIENISGCFFWTQLSSNLSITFWILRYPVHRQKTTPVITYTPTSLVKMNMVCTYWTTNKTTDQSNWEWRSDKQHWTNSNCLTSLQSAMLEYSAEFHNATSLVPSALHRYPLAWSPWHWWLVPHCLSVPGWQYAAELCPALLHALFCAQYCRHLLLNDPSNIMTANLYTDVTKLHLIPVLCSSRKVLVLGQQVLVLEA